MRDWPIPVRTILLFLCFGVFIALFVILSINNRPAADDFEFLKTVRIFGVWNAMIVMWKSWNVRWLAILFVNAAFDVYDLTGSFLFYHIITLLCLAWTIHRFTSSIFHALEIKASHIQNLSCSVLLLISFFFLSFGIAESFFWITVNTMYLWSTIFFLLGSGELIRKRTSPASYILVSISFFYLGGSFETYACIILLFLAALLIYEFRKPDRDKKLVRFLVLSIIFLSASFIFELIGSGWQNRHSVLGSPTLLSSLLVTGKAFVKMLIFYIPANLHWLILFFIAWTGIGLELQSRFPFPKNFLLKLGLTFSITTLLILFPSCYLLRETPPFRTWTLICFLLSTTIAAAGLFAGQKLLHKKDMLQYFITLSFIVLLFLFLKTFMDQKKITNDYAAAFDAREKVLVDAKISNREGIIELEPLPPFGLLYSAEISSDTSFYRNRHVKDYYQLKCAVRKKPLQP
jgi:hypothetical protein